MHLSFAQSGSSFACRSGGNGESDAKKIIIDGRNLYSPEKLTSVGYKYVLGVHLLE